MRPHLTVHAGDQPARAVVSFRMTLQTTAASATFGYEALSVATLPRMRTIAEEVAKRHGLTLADLQGPKRLKPIARARQEAMWLMRQVRWPDDGLHRYSLPVIGRFLGCRDHTTILHGVRRHQERLDLAAASHKVWTAVA